MPIKISIFCKVRKVSSSACLLQILQQFAMARFRLEVSQLLDWEGVLLLGRETILPYLL